MFKLSFTIIILFLISGCSIKKEKTPHLMCPALKAFVNQHEGFETRTVKLRTCWMCGESLGWKHCEAFDYAPGLTLCSYLLKHAQIEYAHDNLIQAVACLADDQYQPIKNAWFIQNDVEYHFSKVEGISNEMMISIYYNKNPDGDVPTLTIESSTYAEEGED